MVSDVDTDIRRRTRRLEILRNNGAGGFTDPRASQSRPCKKAGTFDAAVADFNRDGGLDLWAGTCNANGLFFDKVQNLILSDSFESAPAAAQEIEGHRRGG